MAKTYALTKPRGKRDAPSEVVVAYDLAELPSAFHKAGLAGLVLVTESLRRRQKLGDGEGECTVTATTATVRFTEGFVQKLMDDVYAAQVVEVRVKSKWAGAELKREEVTDEEVDGKPTKVRRFVYDQVQPKGLFFDPYFDGPKEIWRKLWRDMLWSIPRGRPTTRIPFNERAADKPCGEGPAVWADLLKVHKARESNGFYTAELSSALFPGAQAVNAEGVPFEGRAEHNVLLHFWTFVALLYTPCVVERDGATNLPPSSYTLAVPEVGDLAEFVAEYPKVLHALRPEVRGYRPAGAVIDIAAEGGLAFLERLAAVAAGRAAPGELRYSVRSVEYLHLVKEGNNTKAVAAGRVAPTPALLTAYRAIVAPRPDKGEPLLLNPLFRRGLLLSLLDGREWYQSFGGVFTAFDAEVFIRRPHRSEYSEKKAPPQFAADASRKLQSLAQSYASQVERYQSMPEAERPKVNAPLPVVVNRVVRGYLLARTSEKTGVKLTQFEGDDERIDWKSVPAEFNEAKQKLALGLMLEFRSRHDQAFTAHFAATFFSVTQRVAEAERLLLAGALTEEGQRDDLKTLTLLSLSANS